MTAFSVLLLLLFVSSSAGFSTRAGCGSGDRSCSLPQPAALSENSYYFGTQSLWCISNKPVLYSASARAPTRFEFRLRHRLIKYQDYVLEWGVHGFSINYNQPRSSRCPVTWEDEPAGTSSRTMQQVDDFGRMYQFHKGVYRLFLNNCHMFANSLSRFLTHDAGSVSCEAQHQQAARQHAATCPAENLNTFKTTYSHFKELRSIIHWGRVSRCLKYERDLRRFMQNYCGSMDAPLTTTTTAPLTTTTTAPPPTTTLSVMQLAMQMAREREEMLRRGQ